MKILAIETSCDETAIALVEAKEGLSSSTSSGLRFKILKNLVASQIKVHQPFGGIVPNLAKREHLKNLPILFKKIAVNGHAINPDIVAVTVGPGLEPCLWTGINFTKELYKKSKIIGVSHLEGHLYSFLISKRKIEFPAISLLVSGGHTILLLMKDLNHYKKLGETRDDAVGEAFDKVGRLLGLPYPAGPIIEKFAKKGNPEAVNFPRPMINQKNYDFSFSGLKTAVFYYLKNQEERFLADIAASFQAAAFDVLISKTLRAAQEYGVKSISISGGVAANKTLQKQFKLRIKNLKLKIDFLAPPKFLCTDNAAMIAVAGYINYLKEKKRRLTANGNLSI